MNTAKMSAFALRAIMGEAFDDDAYERGRQDARKFFREHPEERESKIEEVKQRLESGVYRHSPGPSYWIGCLCEADFTWMNVSVKIRSDIGFYIGDICYVLDDRLYYGVWRDQNEFADGTFKDPDTGLEVAVAGTAHGDGCYLGSDGAEFPVDAGVIGLVPLELVSREKEPQGGRLGEIFKMPGEAEFIAENGLFTVSLPDGHMVEINTDYEYYEEGYENEE